MGDNYPSGQFITTQILAGQSPDMAQMQADTLGKCNQPMQSSGLNIAKGPQRFSGSVTVLNPDGTQSSSSGGSTRRAKLLAELAANGSTSAQFLDPATPGQFTIYDYSGTATAAGAEVLAFYENDQWWQSPDGAIANSALAIANQALTLAAAARANPFLFAVNSTNLTQPRSSLVWSFQARRAQYVPNAGANIIQAYGPVFTIYDSGRQWPFIRGTETGIAYTNLDGLVLATNLNGITAFNGAVTKIYSGTFMDIAGGSLAAIGVEMPTGTFFRVGNNVSVRWQPTLGGFGGVTGTWEVTSMLSGILLP